MLAMLAALTLASASNQAIDPTASEITLTADPAPLHGTLLTPSGEPRATAVILPGSGPTDRDGNSPLGVAAGTYRLLAEGLAVQGIATVRIDKRGIAASTAAAPDETTLTFDAYVADARAWTSLAAERTGQSCAWLIGHSEGALVALAAARDSDTGVCGLVLLSGAGRPAPVVIAEQLAGLPEPMKSRALAGLNDLTAGRTTENIPGLEALFRPSVQPYLISWFALDPAALIADYRGPVMIGQGTTDIQVGLTYAEALATAQPRATLVRWEGVNHVLKRAPADRAANIAAYADPTLPLAPGVVEAVADFIAIQPANQ